jgi:hypothetical protein
MWATRLACLAALAVLGAEALSVRHARSEGDMEIEDVEFEYPAVDDAIAGAPGTSPTTDVHTHGPAQSTLTDAASDPCDMTGSSEWIAPGEEPVPQEEIDEEEEQAPWAGNNIAGFELKEFACMVSSGNAQLDPPSPDSFNLYTAEFEGNDKNGRALPMAYEKTQCGCVCSGLNSNCGPVNSISYYSSVPSSQACAQMICHKNKFKRCSWNEQTVSQGSWVDDAVKFNTSVVTPIYRPKANVTHVANTTNTTSSAKPHSNTTEHWECRSSSDSTSDWFCSQNCPGGDCSSDAKANGCHCTRGPSMTAPRPDGLLGNFPSSSPAPSPVPTYEDLVNERALNILTAVAEKLCQADAIELVSVDLYMSLQALNVSSTPKVVCTYETTQLDGTNLGDVEASRERNDFIDNALAGFDGNTPLAGDSTRHASESMNENLTPSLLVQSNNIDIDGFNKAVLLLRNTVYESVQCAPNTPPMADIVRMVLATEADCDGDAQPTLLLDSSFLHDSDILVVFANTIIRRAKTVLNIGTTNPSPQPPPPALESQPAGGATNDDDAEGTTGDSNAGRSSTDNEMNPPVFPPLPPSPTDLSENIGEPGMLGVDAPDCDEPEGGSIIANAPVADDIRRHPGKMEEREIEDLGLPELPLFGRQQVQWAPRSADVVVLSQPPEFDAGQ